MRLKPDENIGMRGERLLRAADCNVATVVSQDLCGAPDEDLIEVCRMESRILVTLDRDFAHVLRFPPQHYAGIVVLRLPEPITLTAIEDALRRFVNAARGKDLAGRLWIVGPCRIREHDSDGSRS